MDTAARPNYCLWTLLDIHVKGLRTLFSRYQVQINFQPNQSNQLCKVLTTNWGSIPCCVLIPLWWWQLIKRRMSKLKAACLGSKTREFWLIYAFIKFVNLRKSHKYLHQQLHTTVPLHFWVQYVITPHIVMQ